jgi:hypothetical protein
MLPPRITAGEGRFRDITGRFPDRPGPGASLLMNEMTTIISDGGALASVTLGEVVLRKVVYADGRFHVQIEEARDRIAFTGSEGRASLTYGAETVSFLPAADSPAIERARGLVTTANVVATFRRLAERFGQTWRTSACAVSVHLTAALVSEVAGEPGIAAQVARVLASPVRHHPTLYDNRDDFHDRWAERVAPLLAVAELPGSEATTPIPYSLANAFQRVLTMEAAWYAVVAGDCDTRSRAVR